MMIDRRLMLLRVAVLAGVLGVVLAPVGAQPLFDDVQRTFVDDPTGYVSVGMTESQLVRVVEGEGEDADITYKYYPAGDFHLVTLRGDPNRADDDLTVVRGAGVVNVDGVPFEMLQRMSGVAAVGNPADAVNPWLQAPTPTTRGFEFIYQQPYPIGEEQEEGGDDGGDEGGDEGGGGDTTGGITDGITTGRQVTSQYITIIGDITMMRDAIRVSWTVRNDTNAARRIGFKYLFRTQFGGPTGRDGQPILLPDGTVVERESVWPAAGDTTQTVPDWWTAFDDADSPQVILRGTLTGGEVSAPGFASFSGGKPDRLDIAREGRLITTTEQYAFTPSNQTIVAEDWGVGVLWNRGLLAPGQSRRYVTYYGLGGAEEDFADPYVLAADIPFVLNPNAAGTAYEDFNVRAYANNYNERLIPSAQATIKLPPGLSIVGGTARTQTMGDVALNTEAFVSWNVHADTSAVGAAKIEIVGPSGKSVSRYVTIPALPAISATGLDPTMGLDMISVPFQFQNLDAEYIFQSLGSLTGGAAAIARWDPETAEYKLFPDPFASLIEPGKGYWVVNRGLEEIQLPEDGRSTVPTTEGYQVTLEPGWNMIGNPFTRPVVWTETEVITRGQKVSLREAIDRQVIRGTLFEYDPQLRDYVYEMNLKQNVNPWRGYWVLVLDPTTLVFNPPFVIGGNMASRAADIATTRLPSADDWRIQLVASAGDLTRRSQFAGVNAGASAGYDANDVECPPLARSDAGALQVYFPHPDWGRGTGNFVADMRAPRSGAQSWDFVVATDLTDTDVTLTWPRIREVPRGLNVTLTDLDGGRRWAMRTQEQYTYNSGPGGIRHLRLTVEARGAGGLQISGLTCAAQKGRGTATISYTLNAPAAVDAQITSITGKVIKTLAAGTQAAAGMNTLVWNGTNNAGAEVPNGTYLVNLVARSDAGEAVKAIRTMVVLK